MILFSPIDKFIGSAQGQKLSGLLDCTFLAHKKVEGGWMYYLNFATIIQLLKEFRRSGVLRALLPKGILSTQEACEIQLKLLQGEIVDCQIVTSSGRAIFVDQKVLLQVEESGPQEWTFSLQKDHHYCHRRHQTTLVYYLHHRHRRGSSLAKISHLLLHLRRICHLRLLHYLNHFHLSLLLFLTAKRLCRKLRYPG